MLLAVASRSIPEMPSILSRLVVPDAVKSLHHPRVQRRDPSMYLAVAAVLVVAVVGGINAYTQFVRSAPPSLAPPRAVAVRPATATPTSETIPAQIESEIAAAETDVQPSPQSNPTSLPTVATAPPEPTASLAATSEIPATPTLTIPATPSPTPALLTELPRPLTAAPAPSSTRGSTAPRSPGDHVVQAGETVFGIASRYGVEPAEILRANGLGPDASIRVGQSLVIPRAVGTVYTVLPGDTVSSIARQFGVTTAAILQANGIDDPTALRSGTQLVIPRATGGATDQSALGR
jgi:LysM repeat protein